MSDTSNKSTRLTQSIELGGLHTTTPAPGAAPWAPAYTRRIKADGALEYVSGGVYAWANFLQALPFWIDQTTRDFGDDLYDRMMLDPVCASSVNLLKLSAMSSGWRIHPARNKGDDGYAKAVEIADFWTETLAEMEEPFEQTLWQMLDGLAYGNKVAEQIWAVEDNRLRLKRLKVKPRRSVGFLVNAYRDLVAIAGLLPGQAYPTLAQALIGDPDKVPNILPRGKFWVLTYRPVDEDPRGTSVLQPAYNAWNIKMQAWTERLKYVAQFASPSLIGYTPEDATAEPVIDAYGNPTGDTINPEANLLAGLMGLHNGTAAAFPFGTKVDVLQASGEGSAHAAIQEYADRQIRAAVLGQTLATGEAEHMARAASSTHLDVMTYWTRDVAGYPERTFRRDVMRRNTAANFGEKCVPLTPILSLSETDRSNQPALLNAIAQAAKAGFLDESQYEGIDDMLGLPERARNWRAQQQKLRDQKLAMAQANASGNGQSQDDDQDPSTKDGDG